MKTPSQVCDPQLGGNPPAPGAFAGPHGRTSHACRARRAALLAAVLFASAAARAVLPEPDNVIFGSITRDGVPVTAADSDVSVEVRRSPDGPPIASYTMGRNARLGDRYAVRVKLESIVPVADSDATQTNDVVYLVVSDFNGAFAGTNLVVGARGTLRQLNLGGAPVSNGDSDGDGLPDAWELARFGNLGNGPGSLGANGQTALYNYTTGSDPNDPADGFFLRIARTGPAKSVSYVARAASGAGYEGLVRSYSLEFATNLNAIAWKPVPGQTNITGNNTTISYTTAETGSNVVYRGQVRLLRP